jgi:LEA14-like dessication related protein
MSYQDSHNATGYDYHDEDRDFFNPYNDQGAVHPPLQSYTGGQLEDQSQETAYNNNYPPIQRTLTKQNRPRSGFDEGEFSQGAIVPDISKSAQTLKDYRFGHQGNLCTKGGRARCIGRICCCSLMTTVFLIVSIVLALALWIRPPSIIIGSVQPLSGTSISASSGSITVNLGVDISVINPNYFSVDFTKIEAELFYPVNNTKIGGGNTSVNFKSRSQTNFTFPIAFSYNSSNDQQGVVLHDLAAKCGIDGTKSNLDIDYKISLGIRFLIVTISPVISNSFSFACPISAADVSQLLAGLGK